MAVKRRELVIRILRRKFANNLHILVQMLRALEYILELVHRLEPLQLEPLQLELHKLVLRRSCRHSHNHRRFRRSETQIGHWHMLLMSILQL